MCFHPWKVWDGSAQVEFEHGNAGPQSVQMIGLGFHEWLLLVGEALRNLITEPNLCLARRQEGGKTAISPFLVYYIPQISYLA